MSFYVHESFNANNLMVYLSTPKWLVHSALLVAIFWEELYVGHLFGPQVKAQGKVLKNEET